MLWECAWQESNLLPFGPEPNALSGELQALERFSLNCGLRGSADRLDRDERAAGCMSNRIAAAGCITDSQSQQQYFRRARFRPVSPHARAPVRSTPTSPAFRRLTPCLPSASQASGKRCNPWVQSRRRYRSSHRTQPRAPLSSVRSPRSSPPRALWPGLRTTGRPIEPGRPASWDLRLPRRTWSHRESSAARTLVSARARGPTIGSQCGSRAGDDRCSLPWWCSPTSMPAHSSPRRVPSMLA